jgi:hypothetical protein
MLGKRFGYHLNVGRIYERNPCIIVLIEIVRFYSGKIVGIVHKSTGDPEREHNILRSRLVNGKIVR